MVEEELKASWTVFVMGRTLFSMTLQRGDDHQTAPHLKGQR
jgi:hypothetical protein